MAENLCNCKYAWALFLTYDTPETGGRGGARLYACQLTKTPMDPRMCAECERREGAE